MEEKNKSTIMTLSKALVRAALNMFPDAHSISVYGTEYCTYVSISTPTQDLLIDSIEFKEVTAS